MRPMSIAHHLVRLQARIETVAENNSVQGQTGLGLDDTLAGLNLVGRRRVKMMFEMIEAFSDDPDEKAAAQHLRLRTARAWYGSSVSFSEERGQTTLQRA